MGNKFQGKSDRWYSLRCATESCNVKYCGTPFCPIEEEYKTCSTCCECMDTIFSSCCGNCIRGDNIEENTPGINFCRIATERTTRSYRKLK